MNVLIVDDEPLARDRLKRMVNDTQTWHVVAEAANGEEAVALSDRTRPDVILMDVRMPQMDGVAAAKQIALAKNAPAIIFVPHTMTTALKQSKPRLRATC